MAKREPIGRETLEDAMDGDLHAEIARLRDALRKRPTAKTMADADMMGIALQRLWLEETKRFDGLRAAVLHYRDCDEDDRMRAYTDMIDAALEDRRRRP